MIDYWDSQVDESESGLMIKKLIAQIELIDFYLAKVEAYLKRKQKSSTMIDVESSPDGDSSPFEQHNMHSIEEEEDESFNGTPQKKKRNKV